MKTRKTNKKGISLIVLVITIIVMIILAAAVIVAISNNNIITKANEAVKKTNLNKMKELASVGWTEAYIKPTTETKNDTYYQNEVVNYLKANGITEEQIDNYTITATTGGVTVVLKENNETDSIHFDTMYVADYPENDEGISQIGVVFHENGSAEIYMSKESLGDTMYCTQAIPSGFVYSDNKITGNNLEITILEDGDSISGEFLGTEVTATYTQQELHGVYRGYDYIGSMGEVQTGVEGKIVIKIGITTNYVKAETYGIDANNTKYPMQEFSTEIVLSGQEHIGTFDLNGEKTVYLSADGRKAYVPMDNQVVMFNIDENSTVEDVIPSATGPWEQDGLMVKRGLISYPIGSYVTNYDETNGETITGLTETDWQILGVNEDGDLLLLSRSFIKEQTFGAGDAASNRAEWLTAINTLNTECAKYGHGNEYVTDARSINNSDVDNVTGYDKTTYGSGALKYNTTLTFSWDGDDQPSVQYVTALGESGTNTVPVVHDSSGFWWFDETAKEWLHSAYTTTAGTIKATDSNGVERSAIAKSNYYSYTGTTEMNKIVENSNTTEAYKMLFRDKDNSNNIKYWLASNSCMSLFQLGYFLNAVQGGGLTPVQITGSAEGSVPETYGVRAVVALSPEFMPVVSE